MTRVDGDASVVATDLAAAEEPLDIRVHGRSFAVIMRTPGQDRELAAGFLLSERVIEGPDDLGAVEHCRHPGEPRAHHIVNVFLAGGRADAIAAIVARRREIVATSACGVCGRSTIDELRAGIAPLPDGPRLPLDTLRSLPGRLRRTQTTFDRTGGLHGAGLFGSDGGLIVAAEDIGRHNAVDKAIGTLVLERAGGLPARATPAALMVSGRVSFEIVQKAWIGRVPVVAAVSAPTSLAIELAREARITLVGFLRETRLNIYSEPSRIAGV